MVVMIVPKIQTEIGEELRNAVWQIMDEHNIRRVFVMDSLLIRDSIDNIATVLARIKTDAIPEFDKRTLKHFKKLEEAVENGVRTKNIVEGKDAGKKADRRRKAGNQGKTS